MFFAREKRLIEIISNPKFLIQTFYKKFGRVWDCVPRTRRFLFCKAFFFAAAKSKKKADEMYRYAMREEKTVICFSHAKND